VFSASSKALRHNFKLQVEPKLLSTEVAPGVIQPRNANMALPANIDEVKEKVLADLNSTPYACSSLTALSGGNANFIFRGSLKQKLPDGTPEVVIKHGEPYVAMSKNFEIPTSRCVSLCRYQVALHCRIYANPSQAL